MGLVVEASKTGEVNIMNIRCVLGVKDLHPSIAKLYEKSEFYDLNISQSHVWEILNLETFICFTASTLLQ